MSSTAEQVPTVALRLTAAHRRRLRDIWRSAGWPYQDLIEAELLAAGLLERYRTDHGPETVRVTDAGVREIVQGLRINRAARDAHENLVARVADSMLRAGRLVWRGLSLRAPLDSPAGDPTRWALVMPDVFSIRHTTVEHYVEPIVHEVKVNRADLLADVKRPDKGAAYRSLSSQCWYVLKAGIGDAGDVPEAYGVMRAEPGRLDVLRPAPVRAARLSLATWMTLARRGCERTDDESQQMLGEAE